MKVIGHRGAAALAPENTWEGFDTALKLGVDAIETDVHATSDGQLILIHDRDLARTTNGKGLVENTSWSEIRTLDAGSWFDESYSGAKVPLLQETLERYGHKTHLVLEIKQSGIELEVLAMVQELKLIDSVTFTCFDANVVKNIKSKLPGATLEWLLTDCDEDKMKKALQIGINQICLPAPIITKELVSSWNAIGLPVRAWKVIDTGVMISAIQVGVVGMTVDFPHILLDFLQKSGKKK